VKAAFSMLPAGEDGIPCNVFVYCGADPSQGCILKGAMTSAQAGDCNHKFQAHLNPIEPEYFSSSIEDYPSFTFGQTSSTFGKTLGLGLRKYELLLICLVNPV
jgi:hypothetical protein